MNRNVERAMALGIVLGGVVALAAYAAGRRLGTYLIEKYIEPIINEV